MSLYDPYKNSPPMGSQFNANGQRELTELEKQSGLLHAQYSYYPGSFNDPVVQMTHQQQAAMLAALCRIEALLTKLVEAS